MALARAAEAGGVTSVQLRLKRAPAREQVALARALVAALRVPVLVNDRPDVALAAGAAGVHLGPDDLPVALARRYRAARVRDRRVGGLRGRGRGGGRGGLLGHRPVAGHDDQGRRGDRRSAPTGSRRLVRLAGGRPCLAIGAIRPEDVPVVLGPVGSRRGGRARESWAGRRS